MSHTEGVIQKNSVKLSAAIFPPSPDLDLLLSALESVGRHATCCAS